MEDLKYDILKHPNIQWTADGGAEVYRYGEDSVSVAVLDIDQNLLNKAKADPVDEEEYLFFCEDELEELIKNKLEEKRNEKQKEAEQK